EADHLVIGRLRDEFEELFSGWADAVRRDAVSGDARSARRAGGRGAGVRGRRVSKGGAQRGEVARPLRGRGDDGLDRLRFAMIREALVGTEEEELVANDAATGSSAELVLVEGGHARGEGVARIQIVIAEELPGGSMKAVGSSFGNHGYLRSGV